MASRAGARVVAQTAAETQGKNLIFSLTTSAGLASISYSSVSEAGVPGVALSPAIPAGSTGALVSFNAATGKVSSVLPYAANRSATVKPTKHGDVLTYTENFTAVYDDKGKNLAPGGAKTIQLDGKTGKLLGFE